MCIFRQDLFMKYLQKDQMQLSLLCDNAEFNYHDPMLCLDLY